MVGIMDHRLRKKKWALKKASGPKEVQRKEVVNSWALYEVENKQEWAKEAQSNELSE